MKQLNLFKTFLLLLCVGAFNSSRAQVDTMHALSFGVRGVDSANYYKDYIGVRVAVTSPLSISGTKNSVEANNNTSDGWTDMTVVTTPLINKLVVMPHMTTTTSGYADSLGGSPTATTTNPFPAGSMTGKICVIWRGVCQFGQKALFAQEAGAIACIIINDVPGQGPLGMLAGTDGPTVHIPTFMIGYADGLAICSAYGDSTNVVTMTITPWGLNVGNDLGIIPQGDALWHDYAIPASQLMTPGVHSAYNGMDGAFIGNFGTNNATNAVLSSTVTFTPTGGSATVIHMDSVKLPLFKEIDSIYAMYNPEYNISSYITGNGVVTVNYNIHSDSVDQNPSDDTASYSFYVTDSVFSKSRYDFVNNHPLANIYEGPVNSTNDFYLWGPMYYVAKGGSYIDSVQWTMASSSDTMHVGGVEQTIASVSQVGVFVFKWVGADTDLFVETGELELVGSAYKIFNLASDTSGGYFTVGIGDSVGNAANISLDSDSWYFVAPELTDGASGPGLLFMGCDGERSAYPRTFGRFNFSDTTIEYPALLWAGGALVGNGTNALLSAPATDNFGPVIFGGDDSTVSLVGTIDSAIFNTQQSGLIPSVSMTTTSYNHVPNKVNNVNVPLGVISLFPNPCTDYVNVSVTLPNTADAITYTVLDTKARVVSKVTHNNVLSETYNYSTSSLASGNYFIVVSAGGKSMFKKFTVIR